MKFIEAKQEFQIRHYYWAATEFEKEICESFPILRTFKNGPIWEAHQFMQQLTKDERLTLAQGLLRRSYPDTAKILGEGLSDEANLLLNRFDKFRSLFYGQARNDLSGQKAKYASKRKLRKAIEIAFTKAYGSRCLKIQIEKDWDPWFEMKFAGWIVATRFAFGRRQSMICYYHSIESETKVPNPEFPREYWMPTMRLGHWLSLASWLGISGQTEWSSLLEGEVDQACDAVIKCCGRFFEAVPQLLKGLEVDKISEPVRE